MLEDTSISIIVEIFRPDNQRYIVANMRKQQNAAQDRLFRFQTARRLAIQNFRSDRRLTGRFRRWLAIDRRHVRVLPDAKRPYTVLSKPAMHCDGKVPSMARRVTHAANHKLF